VRITRPSNASRICGASGMGRCREEGLLIRYGGTDVLYVCIALLVG
jgi:hypothetical protein